MRYFLAILLFVTSVSFGQLPAGRYLKVKDDGSGFELFTLNAVTSTKLTDTATALRAWVSSLPQGSTDTTSLSNRINTKGYTLFVQALTSSPADGGTIYFGNLPKAPVIAAATSKVYIPKTGTIKYASIYSYSGTAGTNEAWVMYIRLNNTTDTQIASVSLATSERVWSNSSLNIPVTAGSYIEIKAVNPTWVTNPLTTIFSGNIYIE